MQIVVSNNKVGRKSSILKEASKKSKESPVKVITTDGLRKETLEIILAHQGNVDNITLSEGKTFSELVYEILYVSLEDEIFVDDLASYTDRFNRGNDVEKEIRQRLVVLSSVGKVADRKIVVSIQLNEEEEDETFMIDFEEFLKVEDE